MNECDCGTRREAIGWCYVHGYKSSPASPKDRPSPSPKLHKNVQDMPVAQKPSPSSKRVK